MIEKGKDVSFLVSNRAGKKGESPECFDGMVRERNRRGRIRDLRQSLPASGLRQMSGEIGDREVEPAINAWDLLVTRLKARERNRRATTTLSPILYLFQLPSSTLSQKLQKVLSEVDVPPGVETQRRPGPKDIPYGIAEDEWQLVLARVANDESYRTIAKDYQVSRETIRRLVQTAKQAS